MTSSRPSSSRAIGAMRMPPPKVRAVADGDGVGVEEEFAALAVRVDVAAVQPHAAAGDDGAQGGLGVREAAAEERRRGGGVAVDEPADAGREHVDPVALDGPAVEAREARPADVDGALVAAGEGGEIGAELVRDAERAAEVAAGAGGDDAERGEWRSAIRPGPPSRRRQRRAEQPVHDLVAACRRRRGRPRGGAGPRRRRGERGRVAAARGRDDVEFAEGVADGAEEVRRSRPVRPRPAEGLAMTRGRRAAPGSAVCMAVTYQTGGRASGHSRPCRAGIPVPSRKRAHPMGTPATESIADQSKEVARIAAFSDGVFAIAITLLTLQLEVPRSGDLASEPDRSRPNFLAFVISFP